MRGAVGKLHDTPSSFSLDRVPLAIRACAPITFAIATVAGILRSGLPGSPDRLWLCLLLGLVSCSVVTGARQLLRVLVEWLPFVAIMLAYDLLRGVARGLLPHAHALPQIWFSNLIGQGSVPTAWLQERLWHGAAHLQWYDYATWLVYTSHFFVTPVLAAYLYVRSAALFRRFAAMVVLLAVSGLVTYAVYPAQPPWLSSEHGLIPPTARLIDPISVQLPYVDVGPVFETGQRYANDVAAIPSLHAAYALLAVLFVGSRTSRKALRALLALYPLAMGFALVYSGEHYTLDILFGWVYAAAAFIAVTRTRPFRAAQRHAAAVRA
jgi:membrane-associated phospholipid phosphatase